MMTRNQATTALAGLTVGVIGILSLVAPGYAAADSPWDRHGETVVSNLSPLGAELGSISGTDDSPWD